MIDEFSGCRRIFDDLCDGLYLVDRERVIRCWNRAAEIISGYSPGEVTGNGLRLPAFKSYIMPGAERLNVSIPAGASMRLEGDTHEAVIGRADALMYRSKGEGRNRLSFDGLAGGRRRPPL